MTCSCGWVVISGPSVKARRDRQNLINMPQNDDEPEKEADTQFPSTESVPSHNDTSVASFTVICGNQKNTDISFAVSNEASHAMIKGSHSRMPVDKKKNCSSIATVSDSNCPKTLLRDVCNRSTVTKALDTAVISDQTLSRKLCSGAPEAKTVECPSLPSFSDSSRRKTLSTQSMSKQLTSAAHHTEDTSGVSLRSNFANNTGKTASYVSNSKCKAVQSDESNTVCQSSDAAVCASHSDIKTAKSTTAHAQSTSRSVDKEATGSCVTLGSLIDASVHQLVVPDCNILQPSRATHQQRTVRFEGNQKLLRILVCTVIFF